MTGRKLAAVLFDMDGTLADTEKIWHTAFQEFAARHGGILSGEIRRATIGTSADDAVLLVLDALGQTGHDPAEEARWLSERVAELFARGVEWRPGARELLMAVRATGLRTALVTNTRRSLVDLAMRTLGADNFDVLTCGDEVPRTKPDPAPYRHAARALGVDPMECVAIEDSPAGVASALAAGCAVLAVPHEAAVVEADALILASLLEVDVAMLRTLVGGRHTHRPAAPKPPEIPVDHDSRVVEPR